jgi:hypothetical protein
MRAGGRQLPITLLALRPRLRRSLVTRVKNQRHLTPQAGDIERARLRRRSIEKALLTLARKMVPDVERRGAEADQQILFGLFERILFVAAPRQRIDSCFERF